MAENTTTIQWYPGHMAKARRMLQDHLSKVDVVVEMLDARIPKASQNPDLQRMAQNKKHIVVLNKSDLADANKTRAWIRYFAAQGIVALPLNATGSKHTVARVMQTCMDAMASRREHMQARGVQITVRAMVVGIPNVGKSTLINGLTGSAKAAVGDRPGVTKGKQWIRVTPYFELFDTPGLLWPKQNDAVTARHLAFTGTINDEILQKEELVHALLEELRILKPQAVMERLKLPDLDGTGYELLQKACYTRGWLLSQARPDIERAARVILDEFRGGKFGAITLEDCND